MTPSKITVTLTVDEWNALSQTAQGELESHGELDENPALERALAALVAGRKRSARRKRKEDA